MQVSGKRLIAALSAGLVCGVAVGACGRVSTGSDAAATSTTPAVNTTYVPSGAAAIPPSQIAVMGLDYTAHVRPSTLIIASDGTLARLTWSTWGGARATATGTLAAKICGTNCAASHTVPYRASVVLSDPVRCENRRYYNVATVHINTTQGTRQWGSFLHAPCKPQPLVYR